MDVFKIQISPYLKFYEYKYSINIEDIIIMINLGQTQNTKSNNLFSKTSAI